MKIEMEYFPPENQYQSFAFGIDGGVKYVDFRIEGESFCKFELPKSYSFGTIARSLSDALGHTGAKFIANTLVSIDLLSAPEFLGDSAKILVGQVDDADEVVLLVKKGNDTNEFGLRATDVLEINAILKKIESFTE